MASDRDSVRLFFALWPDDALRERIARAAEEIPIGPPSRRVTPESYHLTLVFLGAVPSRRLPELRAAAAQLAASAMRRETSCTVVLDRLEFWRGAGALVLAAGETPAPLVALCASLRAAAPPESAAAAETRPLRAHVTLARKVAQASGVAEIPVSFAPRIEWRVSAISLVSSQTGGAGSAYTVLDTWQLLYGSYAS